MTSIGALHCTFAMQIVPLRSQIPGRPMLTGTTIFAFSRGFLPIAASTMSLGPQNSFVLRRGLLRNSVVPAAAACFLCDCALICTGVLCCPDPLRYGEAARNCLLGAGSLYLIVFGLGYLRSATRAKERPVAHDGGACLRTVLLAATAVTLLNPLAYIETMLVPAGLAATLRSAEVPAFVSGAISAAGLKFALLGLAARFMAGMFATTRGKTAFSVGVGSVMIATSFVLMTGLLARS